MAAGLIGVFALAWWLDPYDADGVPRRIGTHRQLGMPPCSFLVLTNWPCPSCGMTTSFSLLVHGDLWNSVRANFVGTLVVVVAIVVLPWSLASAAAGRWLGVRSFERPATWLVGAFVALLLLRWVIVVGLDWAFGIRVY